MLTGGRLIARPDQSSAGLTRRLGAMSGTGIEDLRAWFTLQAVNGRRQLLEILSQFLENHFVTQYQKSYDYLNGTYGDGSVLLVGLECHQVVTLGQGPEMIGVVERAIDHRTLPAVDDGGDVLTGDRLVGLQRMSECEDLQAVVGQHRLGALQEILQRQGRSVAYEPMEETGPARRLRLAHLGEQVLEDALLLLGGAVRRHAHDGVDAELGPTWSRSMLI